MQRVGPGTVELARRAYAATPARLTGARGPEIAPRVAPDRIVARARREPENAVTGFDFNLGRRFRSRSSLTAVLIFCQRVVRPARILRNHSRFRKG
jgi:hypothetical protein